MMNGRSSIGGHRAADVRFVDSHCHLDMVQVFDSEAISWMKEAGCLPVSVSYTHLRAHETVLDIVCRLLLEKKK